MSQRHKREHFFFHRAHPVSVVVDDVIGPMAPLDSAGEKGTAVAATDKAHDEVAAWPTDAREELYAE